MQKKLIALAVASLASGAAFAQTNVTMYGIADAGYVYSTGDAGRTNNPSGAQYPASTSNFPYTGKNPVGIPGTNNFSGVQSGLLSGSRLGFRGEEALGNGLKAIFTLEYGLNIDDNSGVGNSSSGVNARQQFVGLAGGFGSITLGRQYSPGYQATANNDPAAGAAFEPQSFLSNQAGNTITPNNNARWNNALAYTTPNWGGFSAKAIYSFGETAVAQPAVAAKPAYPAFGVTPAKGAVAAVSAGPANGTYNDNVTDATDNGRYAVGFNFANGPFNVDAVYQVRQQVTGTTADGWSPANSYSTNPAATGKDILEYYVGGSFDLKVVKLMGSWQQQNDKNALNNDTSLWSLGAIVPVGNGNIHFGYANLTMDQGRVKNPGYNAPYYTTPTTADGAGPAAPAGTAKLNGSSQSAMLAYTYNFSKRTTLYSGYVWTQNDRDSMANAPVAGVGAKGEDNNTFLAGLRHSF